MLFSGPSTDPGHANSTFVRYKEIKVVLTLYLF